MNKIIDIGEKYNIPIIEDAAQAIGSKYNNRLWVIRQSGLFFNTPPKEFKFCGDGGILVTNDKKIYEKAELLRSHGLITREKSIQFGFVSRMDSIQAAILNYRFMKLDDVIAKRRANAKYYFDNLNEKYIKLPIEKIHEYNTYHTFVIQIDKRDQLRQYLKENNIITGIHYPSQSTYNLLLQSWVIRKEIFP